jgi:LysR family transcriptional activator of nhaA
MEWLNYHHLYYFWTVAREGTVAEASEELHLAPSTISKQIGQLEERLGHDLFDRTGRRLVLNDFGRVVHRYADEVFSIGHELLEYAEGHEAGQPHRLHVGVSESIPKLMVRELVTPILHDELQLGFHEGPLDTLLDDLAIHQLDVVLTDRPLPVEQSNRAVAHLLGQSAIGFYASGDQARSLADGFPDSLDDADLLLPTSDAAIRQNLDAWFTRHDLHPRIVAQCQDAAQMKVFGDIGIGAFPAPVVLESAMADQYDIEKVGEADGVDETFYAIAASRRIEEPTVEGLVEHARDWLG